MFINVMEFPAVQEGKDEEFREWFRWTNEQYADHEGFIRRRLLRPRDDGNYVAIVEHESFDTFMAMHNSETQEAAFERVQDLLEGRPSATFYEVVAE